MNILTDTNKRLITRAGDMLTPETYPPTMWRPVSMGGVHKFMDRHGQSMDTPEPLATDTP